MINGDKNMEPKVEQDSGENSSQIEDLNNSHPKSKGPRIAMLCQCNKCNHFFVHGVYERTLERNISLGSKTAPLRAYCPKCNFRVRLHSKWQTNIHAEVPYTRLNRVQDLKDTAEAANMEGDCQTGDLYSLWNENTGYEGKGVPLPFRRWHRRQGGV